jgi:STELLO glycosyltransferases
MKGSLKTSVVITSISAPNEPMRVVAKGCAERDWQFLVIGDTKSPATFELEHTKFYSIDQQLATGGKFAQLCPTKHYTRKNIGYLEAISAGSQLIIDTDDDTLPNADFWKPRERQQNCAALQDYKGWVNVYRYFADDGPVIWPRGLPLNEVHAAFPDYEKLPAATADCPIQQALIDHDPDVDAIYRLLLPLPRKFRPDRRVILGPGARCPFNSQNTTWWEDAFPLLYLPAYCSFRMTDIWRSFVAQRVAWANGWSVLFTEPTTWHDRNVHNLMRDFREEIPGYLDNDRIFNELLDLPMKAGEEHLAENVARSYARLVELELIGELELPLLAAWQEDLAKIVKR